LHEQSGNEWLGLLERVDRSGGLRGRFGPTGRTDAMTQWIGSTQEPVGETRMSRTNDPQRPLQAATVTSGRKARTVLVVDDERDLAELISFNLQRNGYDVICAFSGTEALAMAKERLPDLIVLDIMLPGIDGTEVTRQLKADTRTANIPIVMLTAKSEETDVVVGLKLGADDYVTKPFSMKILLARLESLARRIDQPVPTDANARLKAGPLEIDPSRHEVFVDGQNIKLTLTEFKLLSALVNARGRVLSRDQLMDKAMGTDVFVTDRAIDVHVTAIRKKLGDAAWLVHTVRGVGYRLRETNDGE
jgi:DNA-binding response OmpR family regulator